METGYRDYAARRHPRGGAGFGAVVIVIGALLLLNNLGLFYIRDVFRFWPVAIIAAGLVAVLDARDSGGQIAGGLIMLVGAWLLADRLDLYLFGYTFHQLWPVLLIAFGALLLWKSVEGPRHESGAWGWRAHAIFAGGRRQVNAEDFTGGKVDVVFGGYELDLRQATMATDQAVLETNAVFGGIEIIIPENWSAVVQAKAVFGGVEDKSRQPAPGTPGMKRLLVQGGVVFGGITIRN